MVHLLKVNKYYKIIFILDETIPIRFFLSPYGLTPSYPSVNNRFTTSYYINLVLLDVEDRRYFKQHEITMVRLEKKKDRA
jgi:vacuolar protein sorting-associated protein 26